MPYDGAAPRPARLLAMQTRLTYGDRRTPTTAANALRDLPCLAEAFQAGRIGIAPCVSATERSVRSSTASCTSSRRWMAR